MLVNCLVTELKGVIEEKIFGKLVPILIDINKTGGKIPSYIRTVDDLRTLLPELKKTLSEFIKNPY